MPFDIVTFCPLTLDLFVGTHYEGKAWDLMVLLKPLSLRSAECLHELRVILISLVSSILHDEIHMILDNITANIVNRFNLG